MKWSSGHTVVVGCALASVLSVLVVSGQDVLALISRPSLEAAPPPATAIASYQAEATDVVPVIPEVPASPVTGTPPGAAQSAQKVDTQTVDTQPVDAQTTDTQTTDAQATGNPPTPDTLGTPAAPTTVQPSSAAGSPTSAEPTQPDQPDPAAESPTRPSLAEGRRLAAQLYSGQLRRVWERFSPSVQAEWKTFGAFAAYRAAGREVYGAEQQVLREDLSQSGDVTYYTRTARFERGPDTDWTLILGFNGQGQVQEFGIVGAGLLPQTPTTAN